MIAKQDLGELDKIYFFLLLKTQWCYYSLSDVS